jgi:type IV pilus assembly protein PilW
MRITQRGFTLVELMVSILIGLFLVGGLLSLVQTMKRTSGAQSGLSQLQDNERFAAGLMTDVIEASGDYPNPTANSPSAQFAALTVTATTPSGAKVLSFAKGQSIVGTSSGGATGDVVGVRYATSGTDGLTGCVGGTAVSGTTFVNVFSVDGNSNLQCELTVVTPAGVPQPKITATLVNGITNLSVLYGMKTNTSSNYTSADAYLTAAQVVALPNPPGYAFPWVNIKSIRPTLQFKNPLAGQPGQTATTVSLMRVVNVMNQVGLTE